MASPADQVRELQQRATIAREQRRESAEDLVQKIQDTREEILAKVSHLHALSTELHGNSRRFMADEGSGDYILFAVAHIRLAGALHQGLRRTASTDRILRARQNDQQEETRIREEADRRAKEFRETRKAVQKLTLTSDDAFDELYGDVVAGGEVSNA